MGALRSIAGFLLMSLLLPSCAFADGLPYRHDGELIGEYIILSMDDAQFREVDTLRTMTLTKAQTTLLARLFKTVPAKLAVVSSSFNDNREEASENEVHAVWIRDRTIGVTYNADYASRPGGDYWNHAVFTSVAEPKRLIITHDAKVYRDGQQLTFAQVFRLIDELAKTPPKKNGRQVDLGAPASSPLQLDHPVASLTFSVPPHLTDTADLDVTPVSLLQAFALYGAARNVQVNKTW